MSLKNPVPISFTSNTGNYQPSKPPENKEWKKYEMRKIPQELHSPYPKLLHIADNQFVAMNAAVNDDITRPYFMFIDDGKYDEHGRSQNKWKIPKFSQFKNLNIICHTVCYQQSKNQLIALNNINDIKRIKLNNFQKNNNLKQLSVAPRIAMTKIFYDIVKDQNCIFYDDVSKTKLLLICIKSRQQFDFYSFPDNDESQTSSIKLENSIFFKEDAILNAGLCKIYPFNPQSIIFITTKAIILINNKDYKLRNVLYHNLNIRQFIFFGPYKLVLFFRSSGGIYGLFLNNHGTVQRDFDGKITIPKVTQYLYTYWRGIILPQRSAKKSLVLVDGYIKQNSTRTITEVLKKLMACYSGRNPILHLISNKNRMHYVLNLDNDVLP